MKKTTFAVIILLALIVTACGSASNATQTFPGQSTNTAARELPAASKLAIGSFKLEDTDNAITAKQAADLIPLWQVYVDLSTSDTAAPEEISALTDQIQETMTSNQIQAIDSMNLT